MKSLENIGSLKRVPGTTLRTPYIYTPYLCSLEGQSYD